MQNQMIENLDQYIHLEMLSGYLPGMDEALMARLFGLDPVLAPFVTDGGMLERSSGRAAAQGASAPPYPQRLLVCVTQFGKIDLLRGEMDARGRQVEEFVREWAAAEQRGDAAFLEGALTNDFVGVGPLGFMLNKEQWVRQFAGASPTSRSPSTRWSRASTVKPLWPRAARGRLAGSRATTWAESFA